MTNRSLSLVTYLARDYDEASTWFQECLGFVLLEDTDQGGGKRWVRLSPFANADTAFLIAKATGDQVKHIGAAAGGRVAFFLQVQDFARTFEAMTARGVVFEEAPRTEIYGTVAVFRDLYGNRWDLFEPA